MDLKVRTERDCGDRSSNKKATASLIKEEKLSKTMTIARFRTLEEDSARETQQYQKRACVCMRGRFRLRWWLESRASDQKKRRVRREKEGETKSE
jgi:hypothetical protein